MKRAYWEVVRRLPSVHRFFSRVVRDVLDNRSVVLLLPPGLDSSHIIGEMQLRVRERDRSCAFYTQEETESVARDILGAGSNASAAACISTASDGADALILSNLSSLDGASSRQVFDALVSWTERRDPGGTDDARRTFIVVECARRSVEFVKRAAASAQTSLYWWWNLPSALELRLATQEIFWQSEGLEWLECAVAGLAAGDLVCAAALWETAPVSLTDVLSILQAHHRRFDEVAGNGRAPSLGDSAWKAVSNLLGPSLPSARLVGAWAEGQCVSSREYGTEPSSIVVATRNESVEIARRLWRGQAPIAMPLADDVRLSASRFLRTRLGDAWHARLGLTVYGDDLARLQANPLDAELGLLKVAFERLSRQLEEDRWYDRVYQAWTIRNDLAHYQSIDKVTFDTFLGTAKACSSGRSFSTGPN